MSLATSQITSTAQLLAIARAIEEQAAEQYAELAEAFVEACNADAATAFRELAEGRKPRVAALPPLAGPVPGPLPWGDRDPEISDPEAVHYLMWPWHVFDLALRHEQLTQAFFAAIAQSSAVADVSQAARDLAAQGQAQVAQMMARRDQAPIPPDDWDEDPDPPNWEASD
ncbi:rubrerythrin family protein [Magnetospirillum moscoviense]|uniref:rubrerythrin family protein n=1 Tax=Magnetospirillum moscoviense TaxID=1437059 RepID=UPI000A493FFC|nr:rubrerythrin family protein [Magnetospirillum moscoviense]